MFLNISPSPSTDTDKRCPYLGLRDDLETALGFPSKWNYCHRIKTIAPPILGHQREVCLATEHIGCPVFDAEQQKNLPKELRTSEAGLTSKLIGRWVLLALITILFIISAVIFSGYWVPSWVEEIAAPAWLDSLVFQSTATNLPIIVDSATSTFVIVTTVAPEKKDTETPSPPRESVATTQTELALASRCAYPLESPFGSVNNRFLFHKVIAGETMEILTERYETTQNEIELVNYFLPSPLWVELVIIIPLNIQNRDASLPFRVVLLDEADISLEELAQDLLVSSSELIELNQLDPPCRSFYGWILVPIEN